MGKEKKAEPIEQLEKEFREFQKQWKKFLANDFHHLVVNVDTLINQNDEQHNRIQQALVLMDGNIEELGQTQKVQIETDKIILRMLEKKI